MDQPSPVPPPVRRIVIDFDATGKPDFHFLGDIPTHWLHTAAKWFDRYATILMDQGIVQSLRAQQQKEQQQDPASRIVVPNGPLTRQ